MQCLNLVWMQKLTRDNSYSYFKRYDSELNKKGVSVTEEAG